MAQSGHIDTFAADHLPPCALWPELRFTLPELNYPERLNCVTELLDAQIAAGRGAQPCLIGETGEMFSYTDVFTRVNRIANVLTGELGLLPGNRVLLRSANNPMMAMVYLAVLKAGGVAVATMPMLRARELTYIVRKAEISLALCDQRLGEELRLTRQAAPQLKRIVYFSSSESDSLEARLAHASAEFTACDTAAEDVCLIAFTSGTTGEPKGTMHFHRDMLAICDTFGKHILRAEASDRFIGSPPLAFTFGLGGLVLFPLRIGASAVLLEKASPDALLQAFNRYGATVCFTAPTAYRAMLAKHQAADTQGLRLCVSAGEALPKATYEAWENATGIRLIDGLGATEMLHVFVSARPEEIRPGATGRAIPGFEAKVLADDGSEMPRGQPGFLAVRGPTGCRYLADSRQSVYVRHGWNYTGDTYIMDADGYLWYQARSDDMIISAGYNIAGPEVEASLLTHAAVQECGVVGVPDDERGMIVKAYVVLKPGFAPGDGLTRELQDYVKRDIAPYKYPRAIEYTETLPRTETGKLQRFQLRATAATAQAESRS